MSHGPEICLNGLEWLHGEKAEPEPSQTGSEPSTRPGLDTLGPDLDMTPHDPTTPHEALRRSFDRVLDRLPIGYVLLDADSRITDWNPACERTFGWSRDEALGRTPLETILPPDAGPAFEAMVRRLAQGEPEASGELPGRTRDNRPLFCQWDLTPLLDRDGVYVGAVAVVTDVTGRHEAESLRERLEAQVRQARKTEAIGRLAGGIAHDLNNHLTVILCYADMLKGALGAYQPSRPMTEEVLKAGDRAARLARQLLTLSRKHIGSPSAVCLNDLIGGMEGMTRGILGETIALRLDLQTGLRPVKADPAQLEQILMNLVANARDAMPEGGTLTVATRNLPAGTEDTAAPGVDSVELVVSDTGVGMDEETRARVFEPFFTTKTPEEGKGLGLATVYGILKTLGGDIEVRSLPGEGTTCRILLPRSEEEATTASEGPTTRRGRGGETVLLVEDDPQVRSLAHRMLTRQGYRVIEASDGAEALRWFEGEESSPVDVLVTDVVMPQMSGPELARRLRRIEKDLCVLFLSGSSRDALPEADAADPETVFLAKPFRQDDLVAQLRDLLARRAPGPDVTSEEDLEWSERIW